MTTNTIDVYVSDYGQFAIPSEISTGIEWGSRKATIMERHVGFKPKHTIIKPSPSNETFWSWLKEQEASVSGESNG